MPGFRDRRIVILVISLLIAGVFIVNPLDSQPEGAPLPNVIRGPNWGMDITGGTRIMLQLEAKRAQVQFDTPPEDNSQVARIIEDLENKIHAGIKLPGGENVFETGKLNLLIQERISENAFSSALGENVGLVEGTFRYVNFGQGRGKELRDLTMNALEQRVDPQGTLGAQFKPVGSRYLLYEVSLDKEKARRLLGHPGRLEIYIDNQLTLWGRHIESVGSVRSTAKHGIELPFSLEGEGPERWKKYSEGKAGHLGVIYLDRPDDSVLLFPGTLESDLEDSYLSYKPKSHSFKVSRPEWKFPFFLQVPVVEVHTQSDPPLSENSREFLKSRRDYISQAIWLGEESEIPSDIRENGKFVVENVNIGSIESFPRKTEPGPELLYSWIVRRACGVESTAEIENDLEGKAPSRLQITGIDSEEEARRLKTILSQDLPVEISVISAEEVDRRLSENFIREAAVAGVAAFVIVGILVFGFYRRFKVVIPLLFTMTCEVIITLGAVSAVHDSLLSIGLPGIGGLIAVVGTGVDHQIIIADEVLREKASQKGRLPLDRRTGRAFSVIFSAAATTIAAMVALIIFGFGAMRGFAVVTLVGVLVSVLITRPAFARIIGTLIEREE